MSESKNSRDQVGKSSAGDRIKRLYHQAFPDRKEKPPTVSLKVFVRQLSKDNSGDVQDWFASKAGALEVGRSEKNKTRVGLEASATKLSKKAKKK